MPYVVPPPKKTTKPMNPVWRGIGLVLLFVVFGGSYLLATYLLDMNRSAGWVMPGAVAQLHRDMISQFPRIGLVPLGQYVLPVGVALLIAFLFYALLVVGWGFVRGPVTDPLDVRGPKPRRRSDRRIRKCR